MAITCRSLISIDSDVNTSHIQPTASICGVRPRSPLQQPLAAHVADQLPNKSIAVIQATPTAWCRITHQGAGLWGLVSGSIGRAASPSI
jgi:hypothetical protein